MSPFAVESIADVGYSAAQTVKIPRASSGAVKQTADHVQPTFSNSGSHERERVDDEPLAHARGYIDQAAASFGISDPKRMNGTLTPFPAVRLPVLVAILCAPLAQPLVLAASAPYQLPEELTAVPFHKVRVPDRFGQPRCCRTRSKPPKACAY